MMLNRFRPIRLVLFTTVFGTFLLAADFWESKPYSDWSEKEATKLITDSPWAERYTITQNTMVLDSRGASGPSGLESSMQRDVYRHFHIRWISAKPVRMGLSRLTEIRGRKDNKADPAGDALRKQFVEAEYPDRIVIALEFSSNDQRFRGQVQNMFSSMTAEDLKNNTYLVREGDGVRNFVNGYVRPGESGVGAQLLFARQISGKPFLTEETKTVRLVVNLRDEYTFNVPFKSQKMVFQGRLEY